MRVNMHAVDEKSKQLVQMQQELNDTKLQAERLQQQLQNVMVCIKMNQDYSFYCCVKKKLIFIFLGSCG